MRMCDEMMLWKAYRGSGSEDLVMSDGTFKFWEFVIICSVEICRH
jgi:hypothetical protein